MRLKTEQKIKLEQVITSNTVEVSDEWKEEVNFQGSGGANLLSSTDVVEVMKAKHQPRDQITLREYCHHQFMY